MPLPTREEVFAIFKNLENPPEGIDEFFKSFAPEVKYTIPGHSRFSGYWDNKAEYYAATWAKFEKILRYPGYKLHVPGGINGVITGDDGWSVVIMESFDTYTKSGMKYDQNYSWHMKFDERKLVVECRAYLDLGYLEDVLGTEMNLQGIT